MIETCVLLFEGKQRVSRFYHPSIHQISTLEKTKLYHRPILSSLLCFQRIGGGGLAPDLCYGNFYHKSQLSHYDRVEGALEIKLIIGFDFAVTLSSTASSCVLFDITSRQLVELKWLMLNKHKR